MPNIGRVRHMLVALGILISWPISAHAKSNECAPNAREEDCQQRKMEDDYWADYADRFREWESELAFDPYFYFTQAYWEKAREARKQPMIIATFDGFKSRPWAFAIDLVCQGGERTEGEDCPPKLRMVTSKQIADFPDRKIPMGLQPFQPRSRKEMERGLALLAHWQEADLRSCKGALEHMERLDDHVEPLWGRTFRKWLRGTKVAASDEIIVSTDGTRTVLEAHSRPDPHEKDIYPQVQLMRRWVGPNGGGFAVAWSSRMLAIIQPCLKPASGPPPWENAEAAHRQWDEEERQP